MTARAGLTPDGIAEALSRFGGGQGLEALMRILREGNVETRRMAVEAVRTVQTRPALDFLIEAARDHAPVVRRAAAVAIGDHLEPVALEPLLTLLFDNDLDVRCAAARSLRRFKVDPRAVEALNGCLADAPLPLISAAVESLGEDIPPASLKGVMARLHDLGGRAAGRALVALARQGGASVIPTLVAHYQQMAPEVRPYLLASLEFASSQPARDFLLRCLKSGPPAEQAAAARALGRGYSETESVAPLVDLTASVDRAARASAAEALGALARKGVDVVRPLVHALEKAASKRPPSARPEAYKRLEKGVGAERRIWEALVLLDRLDRLDLSRTMAEALKEGGSRAAAEAHLDGLDSDAATLMREILALDVKWQRVQASSALAVAAEAVAERHRRRLRILGAAEALGRTASPDATKPLSDLLADPDPEVRSSAARALGANGDAAAAGTITRGLTDPEGRVRANAAWALGRLGARDSDDLLVQLAVDRDSWVRVNAVLALHALGAPVALETARRALSDVDNRVRATAARVLGERGGAAEIDPLRAALYDEDRRVRANAAEAVAALMARMGRAGGDVIGALADLLRAEDNRVRANVAVALHPHDSGRALGTLAEMCTSADVWMRASAAWALGEIGSVEAVPHLAALLADSEARVRTHAVRGLAHLRGPDALQAARSALAALGVERLDQATGTAHDDGQTEAARIVASLATGAT